MSVLLIVSVTTRGVFLLDFLSNTRPTILPKSDFARGDDGGLGIGAAGIELEGGVC